ncbi:hypothetical protein [Pedobacter punctiformis]|uniref:Uncharacterized protein n=1 Tax=Pedobacter punctiformis TaxID=3004097 RepID=A0ABT4LA51_9SPHI|nr:hypothetical protein [Pedobacter sp. HCMS5-2]MCZ4244801.1 hypothetical protein [Pedobacter sp. HCMS5-2]
MEENIFFTDIKESIEENFSFLQSDFQFSAFVEKQLAYEIHFETENDFVSIDIWFEATTSTPIWAKINEYYIDNLEPKNKKIENYRTDLRENYNNLFEQYLKTKKTIFLDKISNQYAVSGKEINDKYLKELSEILKRHIAVLNGDFDLLEANTKIIIENNKNSKDKERIEKGIYTIEYQYFCKDEYDMYEEFKNISEIKPYLAERPEIKVYRVFDCYMKEINLQSLE